MSELKIAVVSVSVGASRRSLMRFYRGAQRQFLPDLQRSFFLLCPEKLRLSGLGTPVERIAVSSAQWGTSCLSRYRILCAHSELFQSFDYLFLLDPELEFIERLEAIEILPNARDQLVAVIHPEYSELAQEAFPYERNRQSEAFLENRIGRAYVSGRFQGGGSQAFIEVAQSLNQRIEDDLSANGLASRGCESYWNKEVALRPETKLLSPGYVAPADTRNFPFRVKMKQPSIPRKSVGASFKQQLSRYRRSAQVSDLKIVDFAGGLGNQMFQYAFLLSLKERYPADLVLGNLDHYQTSGTSRRFELQECFPEVEISFCSPSQLAAASVFQVTLSALCYAPHVYEADRTARFSGYWQSERYFPRNPLLLRKHLRPKASLPMRESALFNEIRTVQSVAVHIRRSDYLEPENVAYYHVCTLSYFEQAMSLMRRVLKDPRFFVFTDDPQWASEHFSMDDLSVVSRPECSTGFDDFFLMQNCKHQIISNSTFSWWAAWLNENTEKEVVAPERWLNPGLVQNDVNDILPERWRRVTVEDGRSHSKYAHLKYSSLIR